jgi:hypothetical protein
MAIAGNIFLLSLSLTRHRRKTINAFFQQSSLKFFPAFLSPSFFFISFSTITSVVLSYICAHPQPPSCSFHTKCAAALSLHSLLSFAVNGVEEEVEKIYITPAGRQAEKDEKE